MIMEQRPIGMKECFRMSSTSNHLLTMYHGRRNSSPESHPNALEAILPPAVWIDFPVPRQRTHDPHRDQILILEEVISCDHQPDVAIDLPW